MATRKRCVITLEKKLEIIDALKSGKSQRLIAICSNFLSQLLETWKGREKIENFVSLSECPTKAKKWRRLAICGCLNSALRVLQSQDLYTKGKSHTVVSLDLSREY